MAIQGATERVVMQVPAAASLAVSVLRGASRAIVPPPASGAYSTAAAPATPAAAAGAADGAPLLCFEETYIDARTLAAVDAPPSAVRARQGVLHGLGDLASAAPPRAADAASVGFRAAADLNPLELARAPPSPPHRPSPAGAAP